MDTSDPKIKFDANGVCDHCLSFERSVKPFWNAGERGGSELEELIKAIKRSGRGKEFDCILGLSGGVDSSYLLHLAVRDFGLRPLVFHVDGGWNTDLAVHNIECLVDRLKLDLYTKVIDWAEMRDFQLAFFKSGVPHLDIPQDHAFVATLYDFAEKHGIKYILNGGNFATECVRNPIDFFYYGTDMVHIKDIINKFGSIEMKKYPFSAILRHKVYLRYIRRVQVVKPLNYVRYVKNEAIDTLSREYGWRAYPQKHFESRFTRYYEGYWLPARFGFDTRRVQYSSLILTGQVSRAEALEFLSAPAISPELIPGESDYIARKLGISTEDLNSFLQLPKRFYWDYKNQLSLFNIGARVLRFLGIERSIKR